MRKVSRLMLATIAAIQGGAHSRRKVKYIRERAMLSIMYPVGVNDSGATRYGNISQISLKEVLKTSSQYETGVVSRAGSISSMVIADSKVIHSFTETDNAVSNSGAIAAIMIQDAKVQYGFSDEGAVTNSGNVAGMYLQKILITNSQAEASVTSSGSVSSISMWSE